MCPKLVRHAAYLAYLVTFCSLYASQTRGGRLSTPRSCHVSFSSLSMSVSRCLTLISLVTTSAQALGKKRNLADMPRIPEISLTQDTTDRGLICTKNRQICTSGCWREPAAWLSCLAGVSYCLHDVCALGLWPYFESTFFCVFAVFCVCMCRDNKAEISVEIGHYLQHMLVTSSSICTTLFTICCDLFLCWAHAGSVMQGLPHP